MIIMGIFDQPRTVIANKLLNLLIDHNCISLQRYKNICNLTNYRDFFSINYFQQIQRTTMIINRAPLLPIF